MPAYLASLRVAATSYNYYYYLSTEQCVDASTTWKDDKWKTDDGADDETKFDCFTEECRPEVHQDVTRDVMVIESNVAKETHLAQTHTETHTQTDRHIHAHIHRQTVYLVDYCKPTSANTSWSHCDRSICVSRLFHGQVHPTATGVSPSVDHLRGTVYL